MTRDALKIRASVLAGYAKDFKLSKEMLTKLTDIIDIEQIAKSEKDINEMTAEFTLKIIDLAIDDFHITSDDIGNYLKLSRLGMRYGILMKVVDGKLKFSELKM